jgi:signal transduction histidine kinase
MPHNIFKPILYLGLKRNAYFKLFIITGMACLLSACNSPVSTINTKTAQLLHIADSTIVAGDLDKGIQMICDARKNIAKTDPSIVRYYSLRANLASGTSILFADSALAWFKTDRLKAQYPEAYLQALIAKGDACVKDKKYILALDCYYQAKRALPKGMCDNGDVAQKIGNIYYSQRNYSSATQFWGLSYRQLAACNSKFPRQNTLFQMFSRLNNTGYAFYKLGNMDSASHYYLINMELIDNAEKNNVITKHSIDAERIVTYDNLGGVNLKRGNLTVAESYLQKAVSIPLANIDGMLIPPYVKLGELYLKKGELGQSGYAFAKAKAQLDLYAKDDRESQLRWYRSYAEYLFAIKKPAEAYQACNRYIALKDSLDNSATELYRLDVNREFFNINQRQSVVQRQQQDKLNVLYLVGIGTVLLLFSVIILLINRNLVRSRRNHNEATLRNQQLQLTLDELARVNKNYIRIMRIMAHDIINPISGMTGIASMLMLDDVNEDNRHMLQLIESTGLHSMEMINELLKSGLSNDDEEMKTELVNLRSLLFDSVELLQFKANDKDQKIVFEFAEEQVMANINHEKMWRVFNNLIVNAIKFSHNGSTIKVSINPQGAHILIAIADSGVGIPDKDKDTVFEMFTSAKKPGTNGEQPFGLGLSISKKIVEMHKGKIWFESEAGKGTTFYIELPGVA